MMLVRADQSPVIRINLTKSSSTSVGARVVERGREGLEGRPCWGSDRVPPSCEPGEQDAGGSRLAPAIQGERATLKAHPTTLHPPSPLRSTHHHFIRLMPLGRNELRPYIS
jgi:hypothetical protein